MSQTLMSIGELLDQDEIWISRRNAELKTERLDEMDLEHLKNLRSWLLRQADSIQWGMLNQLETIAARANGEQAQYDIDREVASLQGIDPEIWMRGTVLFEALTDRIEAVLLHTLTQTNVATIQRLCRLAISAPPGTHTGRQLRDIEALARKLEGTGRQRPQERRHG
jgi:hypothetical protein